MPSAKSALLVGASGLVGSALLPILLQSPQYAQVTIFVRKPLPITHEKLRQVTVDFDNLAAYAEYFEVQDIFCTLGTTIKKAGSQAAFKKVDYEYPLELARLAHRHHAEKFLIITALGSDAASNIFYNQVKGQVEQAIQASGLSSIHIFRPSLLLGDRQEFRFGERMGAAVARLLPMVFIGSWRKYKPIQARTVARAMYVAANPIQNTQAHTTIYESDQIMEMGQ
ncbi:oxidoreductase [Brevibacillus dissolubilis]|uniref:oxidoreductase n=1 Tax=Brevibacillus dissolubilis TaxID=1844116 RepID=UPI00111753AD|nr:oxidoreductase [Brevibacillus dissolubilis]